MNGSIFWVTKVPDPGRLSTRPRLVSRLIASRTVFREALLYSSRSWISVGNFWPGLRIPDSILLRRSSAICWYIGGAMTPPMGPNHSDGQVNPNVSDCLVCTHQKVVEP